MAAPSPVGSKSGFAFLPVILGIILALSLAANAFLTVRYRGMSEEVAKAVARAGEAERQTKLLGEKLGQEFKEANSKARKLAEENQGLKDRIEKINEERGAVIIGLEKRIEELSSKESELMEQVRGLEEANKQLRENLEANRDAMARQLKEAEAKAELAEENQGLKDRIEKINEERGAVIAGLEKRIEELSSKESELLEQLKGLEEANQQLRENLEANRDAMARQLKEAELAGAKERPEGLSRQIEEIRSALAAQRETNKQLSAEISSKDELIERLRSEKAELAEKSKNLLKQIVEKGPSAPARLVDDAKSRAMGKEIEELKVALREAISDNEALKAQYSAVIEDIKGEISDKEIKSKRLRERLEASLKAKEDEIKRLKQTYASLLDNLKEEIKRKEVAIVRIKDLLSVKVVSKILFNSGQARVKPEGKRFLDKIVPTLKESGDKEIIIEGHTDNVPISEELAAIYPTNWELSTARATAVARYLQSKGVRADSLSAKGYSYYRPVASNDTEEGRKQNRRIEIVLRPHEAWRR